MRLIGTAKLVRLTRGGPEDMAGAVSALACELTAASWSSPSDLAAQFPSAVCADRTALITLGKAHCVELTVNYDAGMVMIVFAGATAARRGLGIATGERAA